MDIRPGRIDHPAISDSGSKIRPITPSCGRALNNKLSIIFVRIEFSQDTQAISLDLCQRPARGPFIFSIDEVNITVRPRYPYHYRNVIEYLLQNFLLLSKFILRPLPFRDIARDSLNPNGSVMLEDHGAVKLYWNSPAILRNHLNLISGLLLVNQLLGKVCAHQRQIFRSHKLFEVLSYDFISIIAGELLRGPVY